MESKTILIAINAILKSEYFEFSNSFTEVALLGACDSWSMMAEETWDDNMDEIYMLLVEYYEKKEDYEKCKELKGKREIAKSIFKNE